MSVTLTDHGVQAKEYHDFRPGTDEVTLRRPEEGKSLELRINEKTYRVSRVASAFPLSAALDTVAFFDEGGEEIGCMKDGDALDHESQDLLATELEKAYFMPRIRAILSMEEALGIETWTVVTNKGERQFEVDHPRHDVRHLPRGRVLVKDVDGNRYEIPSWRKLDRKSIGLLMRHL